MDGLTALFRLVIVIMIAVNILFDIWLRKTPEKIKKRHLVLLSALIGLFWLLLAGPIILDWYLQKELPTIVTFVAGTVILLVFSGPAIYTCFRMRKLLKIQL